MRAEGEGTKTRMKDGGSFEFQSPFKESTKFRALSSLANNETLFCFGLNAFKLTFFLVWDDIAKCK